MAVVALPVAAADAVVLQAAEPAGLAGREDRAAERVAVPGEPAVAAERAALEAREIPQGALAAAARRAAIFRRVVPMFPSIPTIQRTSRKG